MDDRPAEERLDPALAKIWARNLPSFRDRLGKLERAADPRDSGESADVYREAADAAHKLAGSLGSFGLGRGSELARELEHRFAPGGDPGEAGELRRLVSALRTLIEERD